MQTLITFPLLSQNHFNKMFFENVTIISINVFLLLKSILSQGVGSVLEQNKKQRKYTVCPTNNKCIVFNKTECSIQISQVAARKQACNDNKLPIKCQVCIFILYVSLKDTWNYKIRKKLKLRHHWAGSRAVNIVLWSAKACKKHEALVLTEAKYKLLTSQLT